jgi:hypothetical protein
VDAAYNVTFSASGGTEPYEFHVTVGVLPPELTLTAAGILSGTPASPGSHSIRVQAVDATGCHGERDLQLTVCGDITLDPATLPLAHQAEPYSVTLSATNGVDPYAFTVTAGTLPSGLTLSPAGVISGTAAAPGTFTVQVTATDALGCEGERDYSLTVCGAITLGPPTLAEGYVGIPYSETITASGGTTPYGFAVTQGLMAPGTTLSSGGLITGTPTTAGDFTFEVTATDAAGCSGTRSFELKVCGGIAVSPGELEDGVVDVPYSETLTASGGTPPYTFTQTTGALPPGVTLSSTGTISGTPTTPGDYEFGVDVYDNGGCFTHHIYPFKIKCPDIIVSPTSIPNPVLKTFYSVTFSATGGTPPYTYDIHPIATLPGGLSLHSSGSMSGTPTTEGPFTFTVRATDSRGCRGSRQYSVTVSCPTIVVDPLSLVDGTEGVVYSQTLTASGGSPPYNFVASGGGLPPGLALSGSGDLSGTPTAPGTYTFTISAISKNDCPGSREYTINIAAGCPEITISPASLPPGAVGVSYSTTLTGAAGTPPYSFSTSGGLPPGLTLSTSGLLSGVPTTDGSYTFEVVVSDANGCLGSKSYDLLIAPPSGIDGPIPTVFIMEAPSPNPGQGPMRRFSFALPTSARVAIDVFDIRGRRVARREPAEFSAGRQTVSWLLPLKPGAYVVRMTTSAGATAQRRLVQLQ